METISEAIIDFPPFRSFIIRYTQYQLFWYGLSLSLDTVELSDKELFGHPKIVPYPYEVKLVTRNGSLTQIRSLCSLSPSLIVLSTFKICTQDWRKFQKYEEGGIVGQSHFKEYVLLLSDQKLLEPMERNISMVFRS